MKKIVVVISGPPGSGSSTVGKRLARRMGLKFFSVGTYYKKFSNEKNQSKAAFELWKTKFGSSEKLHNYMDKVLQKDMARKGNIVIDAKLGIHFLKNYSKFKIWLDVPLKIRGERAAKRDKAPVEQSLKQILDREEIQKREWQRMYGFDYLNQKYGADLVVDSSKMTVTQTVNKIFDFIRSRRNK